MSDSAGGATRNIRAFVAVWISDAARLALEEATARLRQRIPKGVQWVKPEGIHLTLKFLGNVRADRALALVDTLKAPAQESSPFRIGLAGLGMFPNPRSPRVVWAGVDGDLAALSELQQTVESAASDLGLPRDGRPFSPHLTMGRVRRGASGPALSKISESVQAETLPQTEPWTVDSLHLIQSVLTPAGAEYTVLGSAPFGDQT